MGSSFAFCQVFLCGRRTKAIIAGRLGDLSGGMLKRVELACAFVVKLEILCMADRIMVLSTRPTTIQATFEVPWEYPRKLSSPEEQELKEAILRELGVLV